MGGRYLDRSPQRRSSGMGAQSLGSAVGQVHEGSSASWEELNTAETSHKKISFELQNGRTEISTVSVMFI